MATGVQAEAAALSEEIAELRHAIHAEPEIGLDLPKTQHKVLSALAGLPLEVSTGQALSSVTAVLRGGKPGRAGRRQDRTAARGHGRAAGHRAHRAGLLVEHRGRDARLRARPAHGHAGRGRAPA